MPGSCLTQRASSPVIRTLVLVAAVAASGLLACSAPPPPQYEDVEIFEVHHGAPSAAADAPRTFTTDEGYQVTIERGYLAMTTFSLLTWIAWRATDLPIRSGEAARLRRLLLVGLVLLAVQIALGGWTSANYAALACGTDFPKCAGAWWPDPDFAEGFVLWRGIGVDYEGGVLDNAARVAIQLAHRMMAVVVFGHLLVVALRLLRSPGLRGWGALLGGLLFAQVGLGIANVVLSLPLKVAVLHNAGATALLFVVVTLLARIRPPEA